MRVPLAQLDGSNGKDVAECWTGRYHTTSAKTFSLGLYRLLNSNIVTREIEGRDAKGPNRMWATVESDKEDGSDQADYMVKAPDQYTNVVADPKYAAVLEQARTQFKTRMAAAR